ncbi:hypothetical protein ACJVDK_15135 [Pedobacter sp. MW01-1-1]
MEHPTTGTGKPKLLKYQSLGLYSKGSTKKID